MGWSFSVTQTTDELLPVFDTKPMLLTSDNKQSCALMHDAKTMEKIRWLRLRVH
jgi:hypothetical protein